MNLTHTSEARTSAPILKPRCCTKTKGGCGQMFEPRRPMQKACSPYCASNMVGVMKERKVKKEVAADKKADREKLGKLKPLSHWLNLTQRVVNAYILARDVDQPCISCGATESVLFQAGHYLSRGARPELRFVTANIAKQCHRCNVHLSGNQAAFRVGLIRRIGSSAVHHLEAPRPPAKFTREQLEAMRKEFAARKRLLEEFNAPD